MINIAAVVVVVVLVIKYHLFLMQHATTKIEFNNWISKATFQVVIQGAIDCFKK